MWLDGALAIWCLFQAFGMSLPLGAACFTGVAIARTVALPQAPGFRGVFHVAVQQTMLLWGQAQAQAQADGFAIVFWTVSFVPVTLVGVVAMWREGLDWSTLRAQAAAPPPELHGTEQPPPRLGGSAPRARHVARPDTLVPSTILEPVVSATRRRVSLTSAGHVKSASGWRHPWPRPDSTCPASSAPAGSQTPSARPSSPSSSRSPTAASTGSTPTTRS